MSVMSLAGVPAHLLLDILEKMDLSSMLKMRQTCTGMDNLVASNPRRLKKRSDPVDFLLLIELNAIGELHFTPYTKYQGKLRELEGRIEEPTVHFGKVEIAYENSYLEERDQFVDLEVLDEVLDVFEDHDLAVEKIEFSGSSQEFIEELLKAVRAPKEVVLRKCQHESDVFFDYNEFAENPVIQNCAEVTVELDYFCNYNYGDMSKFDVFRMTDAYLENVEEFVEHVRSDASASRLQRAEFDGDFYEWDIQSAQLLSEFILKANFHTKNLRERARFSKIFLFDCDNKWIVMTNNSRRYITLKWCDRQSKELLETLEEMVFEEKKIASHPCFSNFLEEFAAAATVEDKGTIFRRLCYDVYMQKE